MLSDSMRDLLDLPAPTGLIARLSSVL